jgi:hypothetical protein
MLPDAKAGRPLGRRQGVTHFLGGTARIDRKEFGKVLQRRAGTIRNLGLNNPRAGERVLILTWVLAGYFGTSCAASDCRSEKSLFRSVKMQLAENWQQRRTWRL